jgi:6-phosphofructokinase 1
MKKIGILTSGGDCAGLNPALYSLGRSLYEKIEDSQIIGIYDGYSGLITPNTKILKPKDFDGLLTEGGTMLRSIRNSFKTIDLKGEDGESKADKIVKNYEALGLDCLVTLGGNGTHKIANFLSQRGLNIVALPKTIDNDIFGTEETFGYDTAVQIGTDYIDRLKTTAMSHSRVFVVEIMGNKAGWLALSTGIATGAHAIILPEIPYSIDKINKIISKKLRQHGWSLIVVSEGAFSKDEAKLKTKDRLIARKEAGYNSISDKVAAEISEGLGVETRTAIPGHVLRGGSPSAHDRLFTMQLGAYAADLIRNGTYGVTVAKLHGGITYHYLSNVAGKAKPVPRDSQMIQAAKNVGITFGE